MKKLKDNLEMVQGKKVIVRANFDVPIEDGQVQDTTRIEDSVSTIKALREHGAQVLVIAHYDRPEGKPVPEKSLRPVLSVLEGLVEESIAFIDYQEDISQIQIPPDSGISMLENLRFWSQEEDNEPAFAQALASFADIYVNQAFANCHREHASIVGLPKHLPAFAGINLAEEIDILSKVRNNPDKPLIVIIGGAKLETKEPLIEVFADKADAILVGGKSAVDLREKGEHLPENVIIAQVVENKRDITEESARSFAQKIMEAKTVIWNGTMGVFEEEEHQKGTRIVAEAFNSTPAYTLIGGGDTETALTQLDMQQNLNFISSGGGAMLTFLSEGSLVGIKALENND